MTDAHGLSLFIYFVEKNNPCRHELHHKNRGQMTATILIADDDPIQRGLLETMVRRFGYHAETVTGGEEALGRIRAVDQPKVKLLILDLVMPDLDGMGVLERLRAEQILVPVIVQATSNAVDTVMSAIKAGAQDFVVKPVGAERLLVSIRNGLKAGVMEQDFHASVHHSKGQFSLRDIATQSEDMHRIIRQGERAAKSSIPVLIEGEKGVGKETFARAIAGASDRKGRSFVTLNCRSLDDEKLEIALFGLEKGQTSGNQDKQTGKFAEANGGTLFLDAIGDLSEHMQARLLKVLQDGEVLPVGARRAHKVDARLIAATDSNLLDLVKNGKFREDLYYRLNVFPITLPSLRQRKADIADLANQFAMRFAAEEGRKITGICAEALALVSSYDWPGNLRQLENALYRAVLLADGPELTVAEFPQIARHVEGFDIRIPPVPAWQHNAVAPEREIVRVEVRDPNMMRILNENGDMRTLEDVEGEMIRFALSHYRSQMSEMARKLGIGRSTLYRKMHDIGLQHDIGEAIHDMSARAA